MCASVVTTAGLVLPACVMLQSPVIGVTDVCVIAVPQLAVRAVSPG